MHHPKITPIKNATTKENKNANKFIEENENMEKSILNDIYGVVKDYDNHLNKLKNLQSKLYNY